jgi:hypothetical protein
MKKSICSFVFIFTIVFSSSIIAQDIGGSGNNSRTDLQNNKADFYKRQARLAFKLIPALLESEIQGVVESTIYVAIQVKKYFPSGDYTEMMDKLNRIAENNPDPSIRAKAYLAGIYLNASDMIDVHVKERSPDYNYIFEQITEQLDKNILAHK